MYFTHCCASREADNSRSYQLLKTCQTCTTASLRLCLPAFLIMSSQQHCKTGTCGQQNQISLAERMTEWQGKRGQQEFTLFTMESKPSGMTTGISLSDSLWVQGEPWAVTTHLTVIQGLMCFISEAFGLEHGQVIMYLSFMHWHLITSSRRHITTKHCLHFQAWSSLAHGQHPLHGWGDQ